MSLPAFDVSKITILPPGPEKHVHNKKSSQRNREHACQWDGHPVNVGLDKVALRGHRLAQVLQVLKHLRFGPRCPLEVLELGGSTKPLICNITVIIFGTGIKFLLLLKLQ